MSPSDIQTVPTMFSLLDFDNQVFDMYNVTSRHVVPTAYTYNVTSRHMAPTAYTYNVTSRHMVPTAYNVTSRQVAPTRTM